MSIETKQRKLAAIMFTDMVGYSALSQRDDKLALELLEEHRVILRKIFPEFNGTEIKTIGDAFLVEFNSALEAAECAIAIQRALAKRDADAPAERQIQVRIGIHIGDVVHRGGDVYGDGVNIASRIEPLAEAGGICVSMDVERQIRNAVETRFEKLAPTELKNISVSMDLFRIVLPWEKQSAIGGQPVRRSLGEGGKSETTSARFPWHEIVIGILLLAALMAGAILWFHRAGSGEKTASGNPAAATPSITPKSVAVLPFENLSSDKENAFFTDGVQDQILTDLAQIADLKVISRTSVMQYKTGAQRNLREIGQQLGVAHLLEGSVQRAANKVRVTAQLINARTDTHLWAQTYDRDLADVFAIQSEIAKSIADQLRAKILPREKLAIEETPTKDMAAYDLYVRATKEIDVAPDSMNPKEHLLHAIGLLDQAIGRDPTFFNAYCKLAQAHDQLYLFGDDHTPARLTLAQQAIDAALRLQPDAGEAHLALAVHLYSKLDYDGARKEIETARRNLPNDPVIFELSGYIDRRQGRWQESTRNLERALELDPNNVYILNQTATSYQALREYDKQAATLDRILVLKPNDLDARLQRAGMDVFSKADPRPLHQVIETAIRENPAVASSLAPVRILLATAERDPVAGERAAADLGQNTYGPDAIQYTRAFCEGFFARLKGDPAAAQAAFTKARAEQQQIVNAQPDYGPTLIVLGLIDAGLGRKDDALREGRRAAELMPRSKDSINGAHIMTLLGAIYSWVGEKDLAIEQLSQSAHIPCGVHYGQLRLWSNWDEVRGDPRFEKIVNSLAPK